MKAFPDTDYDACFDGAVPSRNSIKALCNVAVKVTVTGSGIVKWAPIVKDSYGYGGPGPYGSLTSMNCREHNASGLFRSESCPAAPPRHHDTTSALLAHCKQLTCLLAA
jgi:hypothetical protein